MDLNTTWFVLFGVLIAGYAVLDGFDLGAGVLSLFTRHPDERRVFLNAVGPVWDGNEVWLLTGGGALFAAFPPVYATAFSGLYLALMLLLVFLIARAVCFEFRGKVDDPRWRRVWDLAFGLGSLGPALLFGVAVGNVLRGLPLDGRGEFAGSFLGLLNPYALLIGLLALAMFTAHGALFLIGKTEGELRARVERWAWRAWLGWAVLFGAASLATALAAPQALRAGLGRPLAWLPLALVVAGLVAVPALLRRAGRGGAAGAPDGGAAGDAPGTAAGRAYRWAFLASAAAVAGSVFLVGASLYPALLPAYGDPAASLTIYNASSTPRTLGVMLVIALVGMPLVIGYTAFIYRVFKGRVVIDEHSY